uniref:RRM domain-containing protein n=1 Tax=Angiostrongylus cantonensis TaxID=6313 RepID=A0A0K0DG19_ANGCA
LKTGNFKGWAFVGFADKEVAEIAAETMNGYLMFEKRLSCHVRSNFHLIASCLTFMYDCPVFTNVRKDIFLQLIVFQLMDPNKVPKSMKSGPRYVAPPHMRGRAKRDAFRRNKCKSVLQEERAKVTK